jgi:hypothetical protein
MMTRLGALQMDKQHRFSSYINGLAISPLLQDICLRFAQCEIYARSAALLAEGLNLPSIYATQLHRLVESHAPAVARQLQYVLPPSVAQPDVAQPDVAQPDVAQPDVAQPDVAQPDVAQPDVAQPDVAQPDVVCAQADGSMIRCQAGWKEVKVGRLFALGDHQPSSVAGRSGQLLASSYVAHLGAASDFKPAFSRQLTCCLHQQRPVVFISDGAPWLRQYLEAQHPSVHLVLDFYHVMEHLGQAAQAGISRADKRANWLDQQSKLLKESDLDQVLANLDKLPLEAPERDRVRGYLLVNADRMDYKRYEGLGWPIGSGAVEATHRVLVQARLKRSGQYWSEAGAQRILDLRVVAESDRWDLVQALLKPSEVSYAMAA